MKVLVFNTGSSTIKYQLFEMPAGAVLAKGLVQRIGEPRGKIEQHGAGGDRQPELEEPVGERRKRGIGTRDPGEGEHGVGRKAVVGRGGEAAQSG